jgi:diaminopimelate epimerase
MIEFTKLHGAGNDFVLLDATSQELPPLEEFSRRIADRHFGIGADQVLVVERPTPGSDADFRMDIYNADGSRVEMCANGIRAFYEYLRGHGHTDADEVRVETLSGVVVPRRVEPGRVRVDMGLPVLEPAKIPTTLGSGDGPVLDVTLPLEGLEGVDGPLRVSCVSLGNPHCVIEVANPDAVPIDTLGPSIEQHDAFPNRVNVEFIAVESRRRIRQRTWERGTGETLACGSGACAVAVTAMLRGVVDRTVEIELRGGELEIVWQTDDSHVFMTGPAVEVYSGRISKEGTGCSRVS